MQAHGNVAHFLLHLNKRSPIIVCVFVVLPIFCTISEIATYWKLTKNLSQFSLSFAFLLISFALPIHFCVSCVFYAFLVNFCTVLVCKIFVQFFEMKFSFQNLCFTLVFLCFWFWCFASFLCRYFAFLSAFFTFHAHAVHDERSHSFSPPFSLSQFTL